MYTSISFQRDLPIKHEVDVFIAGGGPAGVAAALAARRLGVSVFLAEGQSCFGGMGTAGMVPAFMRFSDGIHFLAGGIGQEIYERLREIGPEVNLNDPARSVSINVEALKNVYDEMMVKSGAQFSFSTQLISVEVQNGFVKHAVCAAKSGIFAVKAAMFIDCTGDGDLAAWSGAPFEKGDENGAMMPGTLCSVWSDVDWDTYRKAGSPVQSARVEEAHQAGVFSFLDRHLPGMWQITSSVGGGNIGHTFGVDGTDEDSLTEGLLWGRKSLTEYKNYYQEFIPGFGRMYLAATGSLLGIRETRRIIGDYVLGLDDFLKRAVFDDEIGRYSYPVDIHASNMDKASYEKFHQEITTLRHEPGESYGIPYRVLTPLKLENVLVAGRCVSSDRYVQSSIRVMPGCYITGQAAGIAAALAARQNRTIRQVEVKEVQQNLKDLGAYLPNA